MVGRGGKHGAFSCRGQKGQKARAGRKMKPAIREIIKRYPKLRGYKLKSFELGPTVVNLEILDKNFNADEIINPKILLEKGLVARIKGRVPEVKILGEGKINKKIIVEGCLASGRAKEKIEKAGGTIKLLNN